MNAEYSAVFVLTWTNDTLTGYSWVGAFKQAYADGGVLTAHLFARDDVVRERGVPTGIVQEWS